MNTKRNEYKTAGFLTERQAAALLREHPGTPYQWDGSMAALLRCTSRDEVNAILHGLGLSLMA